MPKLPTSKLHRRTPDCRPERMVVADRVVVRFGPRPPSVAQVRAVMHSAADLGLRIYVRCTCGAVERFTPRPKA